MTEPREEQAMRIDALPIVSAADAEDIVREKRELVELSSKGPVTKFFGYFSKTGPGFLQSAFTLGSGTAVASLYLGTHYQYKLLWVQPFAMLVGIIMLMAAAHQTLSTSIRPFDAMRRYLHPSLAWIWAIGTLIATVVWHLPQYALAAGVTEDMTFALTGWAPQGGLRTVFLLAVGLVFLAVSTVITWNYGSGWKGIKLYERMLKIFIIGIVIAFFLVMVRSAMAGKIAWGRLFKGFLPLYLPTDPEGVTQVMAAFSAAVGINMTFLFGYTLLARGWGKEHRTLAKFDLIAGMLIPYTLVTSLIIIAAGCTIYGTGISPNEITPANAGTMIGAAGVGPFVGRIIFGCGILGMALSTITLHMLVSGFAVCEIFGIEVGGWKYRLACLVPAPAFLGVILWKSMGTWIALPTSAFCLILLPIPYVGWFILQNSARYLGDERPSGVRRLAWNGAMLFTLIVTFSSVAFLLIKKAPALLGLLGFGG